MRRHNPKTEKKNGIYARYTNAWEFLPQTLLLPSPLSLLTTLSLQFHNLPLHLLNRMQQYPR